MQLAGAAKIDSLGESPHHPGRENTVQDRPLYDLFLTGGIVPGHDDNAALAGLATLFKQPMERIRPLLLGKPHCIKRGLTEQQLARYQQALDNIGVLSRYQPTATPSSATEKAAETGLSLSPPGTPVLTEAERETLPTPEIDTDTMVLAPLGETLTALDAPVPLPQPDTDYLSVAELGSDLGEALAAPAPAPRPGAGTEISIAAVGSVLDTRQRPAPPPVPDTRHIKLID